MSCNGCAFRGDDGLCFCEESDECPRGLIEEEEEDEEWQE